MLQHQCTAQRILHDHRDMAVLPEQAAIEFAQAIDGVLVMRSLVADACDVVGGMQMEHSYQVALPLPPWAESYVFEPKKRQHHA